MKESKNQLRTGAVLSYVNLALSSIIPFFYTPVMLRMLGDAEYGLYSLSASVISYLSLLSFGFGGTIVRYITMYRAKNDKKKEEEAIGFFLMLYSAIAVLVMICGVIVSFNAEPIFHRGLTKSELDKMQILMLIMAFNSALSFPISVFSSIVMAHEKYIFRRLVDMLSTVIVPVFNLIALYLGFASVGMAVSGTIIQFLMLPINMIYCFRKLDVHPRFARLPQKLIKEMVGFSAFVFIGTIVDMLFWSTDKVILGMLAGTGAVAVYNIGCTFNTMVTSLSTSLSSILTPRITTMVVQDATKEKLTELFIRIGRIQYIIVALVISGFTVFGRDFINLWAGKTYANAYWIAILTLFPLCIPLIQNTGLSIVMAQNKHQFRSICYLIIAIVNVISTYLIVPRWGGIGAAFCSGISYVIGQGFAMNIYYYKVIGIDIPLFWKNIFKMSIFPGVMILLGITLNKYFKISNWYMLFILVSVFTGSYIFVMFKFGMNEYEKNIFVVPIRRLIQKIKQRKLNLGEGLAMEILQNEEKLPGNKCKQVNNIVMSVLFIVLQYAVSINIFLMGDDFMYTVFAREGCIKSAWNYYFTGNGRWILNILDSWILKFDRYAYVIILPWLMLLFAWLVYKLSIRITKKQSTYGFLVSLLIVSSIDISISRETIYWITGGLNYLFPAILFLAAADIILYLREEKKCVTWKKVIGGILIIVASTTMEQFGLMTFGWMTLLFAYDVYKKKKIEKSLMLIYIMSLIGLATMLLAPGNFVRISYQAEVGQSLFIKLIDLFYMNYFSVQAAKFITVLTIVEGVILFKNKKYKIGIASLINAFLLFTSFILSWLPAKMPVAILSLFILCISTAYVVKVLNIKCNLYYVGFILLILLCGSQFMLLTGTLWGFRTSFSAITIYSIFTLIIFIAQEDSEICYTVLCGIAFCSNWVLGVVVSLCILIIIFKKSNCQNQVVTILTCLVMCVSIIPVALGYYENRSVQEENIDNAIESQKNSDDTVEIYKYSNEMYGWTNPPYGEIHEQFFRKCYGIPESVTIVYKDNK